MPGRLCYCEPPHCVSRIELVVPHAESNATHTNLVTQELASSKTCALEKGGACFSAVEEVIDTQTGQLVAERSFGCLPAEGRLFQCQAHLVPHRIPKSIACCSDADNCNRNLFPIYESVNNNENEVRFEEKSIEEAANKLNNEHSDTNATILLTLSSSALVCFLLFLLLVLVLFIKYRKKECRSRSGYSSSNENNRKPKSSLSILKTSNEPNLSELIEQSSGSGQSIPLLVQRTIAKQVQIKNKIGKGKFAEVWLGTWRAEDIAVKVYSSKDECSWFREADVYQTVLMRHDNILGFIAADIKGQNGQTLMLLLTDYHANGSLFDFLQRSPVDADTMLSLCYTFICGLSHLHTEMHGIQGKPAIAHRDIKSKNILVKADGRTCVVADFALAVRYDSEKMEFNPGSLPARIGTYRYMAPEMLEKSIESKPLIVYSQQEGQQRGQDNHQLMSMQGFSAFLEADMYSAALVLWEVVRRTITHAADTKKSEVDDSCLPYFEYVSSPEPSLDEMHTVACMKQLRPSLSNRFHNSSLVIQVMSIATECWHANPRTRPSAMRVKKSFADCLRERSVTLMAFQNETSDKNINSLTHSSYSSNSINSCVKPNFTDS